MGEPRRRPAALRPGDSVAVVAPSGPVDPGRLDAGLATLRHLGLHPTAFASTHARTDRLGTGYLAGDDVLRAKDLTTALADPAYRAVFCARGGYGAQRVIDLVEWDSVDPEAPRVVVGFSDVTALLEAVTVHLGWVSMFGPMVSGDCFHPGDPSLQELARILFEPDTATTLTFGAARELIPGSARGTTHGGTVSLLASSVGTPTSASADGAIVLLEEIDEAPYRLDRLLTQLRRSGYLDGAVGILAGNFKNCGSAEQIDRLLVDRLESLGVPVLAGADIGHGRSQRTYPLGVRAELDTSAGALRLCTPALDESARA